MGVANAHHDRIGGMPVIVRLKDIATARGYKNAKALAESIDMPLGVIYPLWNDVAKRFDRKTIERLCDFLNVPAGVLIEYNPAPTKSAGHK
jgi:DNA-binding Xre family transcriptional regulator